MDKIEEQSGEKYLMAQWSNGFDAEKFFKGGKGDFESQAKLALNQLYASFRFHAAQQDVAHERELRDQADRYQEKIDSLRAELDKERHRLATFIRDDEEKQRNLTRYKKGSRTVLGLTCGLSFMSLVLVGGLEGARFANDQGDGALLEQLKERVSAFDASLATKEAALGAIVDAKLSKSSAEIEQLSKRVDSYDEAVKNQAAQMKSFMVAQNDKSGSILKAIDVIKYNQSLVEYWASDDGKNMFKEIRDWIHSQKESHE